MNNIKNIPLLFFTMLFLFGACGKDDSPDNPQPKENPNVAVTGVTIDQTNITLPMGETEQLSADLQPTNATNKTILWETGNQAIVSVDSSGKVSAISPGTVSISAVSDENGRIKDEITIEVVEAEASAAFITTWNTELGFLSEPTVVIPTFPGETYDYNVDWGDGSLDSNLSADVTHVYDEHGIYEVKITGQFPRIYFDRQYSLSSPNLVSIDQWGINEWTSMESAFDGCDNLDVLATDTPNLSKVTNMKKMFSLCRNLKGNESMNSWDVSGIEDMSALFAQCELFNIDIGSWNTSNVVDMTFMFESCDIFNQNIGGWDVGSVKNMGSMFSETYAFNQDIGDWNTEKVEQMQWLFKSNNVFNQDIGSWNVSNVIDMSFMFSFAESFNQPIGNWNVSSVTDMQGMLSNAISFNQDISNWNVSGVANMRSMFANLSSFNADLSGWDVSNVENMGAMFTGCSSFNQDLSSWNVSKVTSMINMFGRATIFNQDISGWDVNNVDDMRLMFSSASAFNQDIGVWDVSKVFNMEEMFSGAISFDQDLGAWDVSNVRIMKRMFRDVQLSTMNYDALLTGWSGLPDLQIDVEFDAGESKFCNSVADRLNLTANFSWLILDGGNDCD